MRLKKRYLAVIIAVILITTAVLASFVVSATRESKVAYVSVKVDKSSFTLGEDVTFQLYSLTPDVEATGTGRSDSLYPDYWSYGGAGVHIVRIPDGVDPSELLVNNTLFQMVSGWDNNGAEISFDQFSSTSGPLELSWQSSYKDYRTNPEGDTVAALAGYYIVYPVLQWVSGHNIKFMLDESAIFYLDSVGVSAQPSSDESSSDFALTVTVSAPHDYDSTIHCELNATLMTNNQSQEARTFDLAPHSTYEFTVFGTVYYQGMYVQYSGYLDTGVGNFTINMAFRQENGGWVNAY